MEALAVSREYFKHAVVEFWSKIQKRCLRLPQQLFHFFKNLAKPADIYTVAGHNEGGKGGINPRVPNHYGEHRMTAGVPKGPNNATSTFFSTVHLLPKDLKFEHGGAKVASCPGGYLTRYAPVRSCVMHLRSGVSILTTLEKLASHMAVETPTGKPALSSKHMVGKAALYFQTISKTGPNSYEYFHLKTHQEAWWDNAFHSSSSASRRSSLIFLVVELTKE